MTHARLALVLSLCCLVPDARADDGVHKPNAPALRDALFREKGKFPLVEVKTVDPSGGAPVWMRGQFNAAVVVVDNKRYSGFRFKAERAAKGVDFVWAFQPSDNLAGWFIEAEAGDMIGFCEYGPLLSAIQGKQVWTQPLPADRFKDGGEYMIWFAFKDATPADIRFTFLFRKLEGVEMTDELDEEIPPVLTVWHRHFSDHSILQALSVTTFGGVGCDLATEEKTGRIVIQSVVENGPAAKVGLLPGDAILSIDGQELTGLPLEEAITFIKGKPNSTFNIVVHRPATGMTITGPVKRNYITVIDTGE